MNRRSFLTSVSLLCLSASSRGFSVLQPASALEDRVKAQLDLGIADELTVGAVVMVAQHKAIKVLDAAGFAARDSRKPMRTDAIFDIRFICKPITVLGALLLVQDGKLKLDTSLSSLLPQFSNCRVAGQNQLTAVPITMRELMTHTSGIAAQRPPELQNITRTFDHTLAEDVDLVAKQPLDFVPGTRWSYSSSGIAVLGRVIDPTMYNMENGHLLKDAINVSRPNQKYSAPDFGLLSTAEDLRHLAQMMLNRGTWKNRRFLSAALVDEATWAYVHTSVPKYHAGLGWAVHLADDCRNELRRDRWQLWSKRRKLLHLWIDPKIQLIRIYLTQYFGDAGFEDGNPVMNAAFTF